MNGYNHLCVGKCLTDPGWKGFFTTGGKVGRLWQEMESAEAWRCSHGHQIAEGSAAALIAHGCISNALGKLLDWVNKPGKYGCCGQAFHVRLDFMIFNMLNSSQLKMKERMREEVTFSILSLHWPQLWWTRRPYCNVEQEWGSCWGSGGGRRGWRMPLLVFQFRKLSDIVDILDPHLNPWAARFSQQDSERHFIHFSFNAVLFNNLPCLWPQHSTHSSVILSHTPKKPKPNAHNY